MDMIYISDFFLFLDDWDNFPCVSGIFFQFSHQLTHFCKGAYKSDPVMVYKRKLSFATFYKNVIRKEAATVT